MFSLFVIADWAQHYNKLSKIIWRWILFQTYISAANNLASFSQFHWQGPGMESQIFNILEMNKNESKQNNIGRTSLQLDEKVGNLLLPT